MLVSSRSRSMYPSSEIPENPSGSARYTPAAGSSRASKAAPPELDDLLLDLARVARRRNKALELNGRDIDYAPELVRRLATACSKADCRVSLGSDAHHPSEVFRNMSVAMALVKEFDLELTQQHRQS